MEKFAPLNLSPEELIAYTSEWQGERLPDIHPKVPDDIVQRMSKVTIAQAWGVLRRASFNHQYEDSWQCTHPTGVLCG